MGKTRAKWLWGLAAVAAVVIADEVYVNCQDDCIPWNNANTATWIATSIQNGTLNATTSTTINVYNSQTGNTAYTYTYNNYGTYTGWVQSGYTSFGGGGGGGFGGSGGSSGGSFPPGTFCLDDGSNCDTMPV